MTQLVIHSDFRERGLAVGLLQMLKQDDDAIYGLMSSHPAACLAAAKAYGSKWYIPYRYKDTKPQTDGISALAMNFIRENAVAILKASPIS